MKFFSVLIFLIPYYYLQAQLSVEDRMEIEYEKRHYVTGEHLLNETLIVSHGEVLESGEDELTIKQYDKRFKELNSTSTLLPRKFYLKESTQTDQAIFYTYLHKKGDYLIYILDVKSFSIEKISGIFPEKHTTLASFHVLGEYLYLTCRTRKSDNFVIKINHRTGKKETIVLLKDGVKAKHFKVDEVEKFADGNSLVYYIRTQSKKGRTHYTLSFDVDGNKTDLTKFINDDKYAIISSSGSILGDNRKIFCGTYGKRNEVGSSNSYSSGIYFALGNQNDLDVIKFHPFIDLKNFMDYLPEKKQAKLEKKIKKKKAKGKTVDINYRLAVHPIYKLSEDEFMFLGEAFFATYRTETTTTTNANGQTVTTTRTVFDGYQYTHAILIRLNGEGEIIWDRSFELKPSYKPYTIKRFIHGIFKEDLIEMVYVKNGYTLSTLSFNYTGEVVKDIEEFSLIDESEDDKVRRSSATIVHWYNKNYLLSGFQKIVDKSSGKKDKRSVYYFERVQLND